MTIIITLIDVDFCNTPHRNCVIIINVQSLGGDTSKVLETTARHSVEIRYSTAWVKGAS